MPFFTPGEPSRMPVCCRGIVSVGQLDYILDSIQNRKIIPNSSSQVYLYEMNHTGSLSTRQLKISH